MSIFSLFAEPSGALLSLFYYPSKFYCLCGYLGLGDVARVL